MQIKPIVVVKGLATFIPGVMKLACGGSGGTDSSRYCYSVWMRHLVRLAEAGCGSEFSTVAELGPGDSFGIGLCAMLTGGLRYFAFDAVAHARTEANLQTIDDLVGMVSRRESVPGNDEFPEIAPPIGSLKFPEAILPRERVMVSTRPERVAAMRRAVQGDVREVEIRYVAPWADSATMQSSSLDLTFSQAVLEHVEDISSTYQALFRWLKPGAVMSHEIDFKSHGLTRDWYGHWTVGDRLWRVVRGRRPYLINRLPASAHIAAIEGAGFDLVVQERHRRTPPLRAELARRFRDLHDDDLQTAGLYVIARKPARQHS